MKATTKKFKTVDEYFSMLSPDTKDRLSVLRNVIKKAAPGAEEQISYNMPSFKRNGMLVYYAAYDHHIGFYPTASGIKAFKKELSEYEGSKGTLRIPIDKPIPAALITKIVKFRMKENMEKAKKKTVKPK